MTDHHSHLHRLVESRADDMGRDPMTRFQALAGIHPTLPGLAEMNLGGLGVPPKMLAKLGDPVKVEKAGVMKIYVYHAPKAKVGGKYVGVVQARDGRELPGASGKTAEEALAKTKALLKKAGAKVESSEEDMDEAKQQGLDFGGGKATSTEPKPGSRIKIKGKIWTVTKSKKSTGAFGGKAIYSIELDGPGGKKLRGTYQPHSGALRLDPPGTLTRLGGHISTVHQNDMKFIESVEDDGESLTEAMKRISGLAFEVIDMRGQRGFPSGDEGLVYHLKVEYKLKDKYTGEEKKWKRQYVIRTDHKNKGWRIDEVAPPMPAEAVPGLESYYKTPQAAAKALAGYLKGIKSKGVYVEERESLTEELRLSKADKKVIDAFIDGKRASSKKLHTDGKTLDGMWMGGKNIATWEGGKIAMDDPPGRAVQTVQRALRRMAPKRMLGEADLTEYLKPGRSGDVDMKLYHIIRKNPGIVNGDLIKRALKTIREPGLDKDDVLDFVHRYSKALLIQAKGHGWKVNPEAEKHRKAGTNVPSDWYSEDVDDLDEARPYDPEEDPRRATDLNLYKLLAMVQDVGGERKLGKGAFKKVAAVKREMTKRGLPKKMPPKSAFHRGYIQDKRLLNPKAPGGGIRAEDVDAEQTEAKMTMKTGGLTFKRSLSGWETMVGGVHYTAKKEGGKWALYKWPKGSNRTPVATGATLGKAIQTANLSEDADDLTEAPRYRAGQKIKVPKGSRWPGEMDTYKIIRVYPTKDDAVGPFPSTLTRLIKKGEGALLGELLPGKGEKKEKGGISGPSDTGGYWKPAYYILYVGKDGKQEGGPVSLKPHQYKRAMSYQYSESVEDLAESVPPNAKKMVDWLNKALKGKAKAHYDSEFGDGGVRIGFSEPKGAHHLEKWAVLPSGFINVMRSDPGNIGRAVGDVSKAFKAWVKKEFGEAVEPRAVADGAVIITEDVRRFNVLAGVAPLPPRRLEERKIGLKRWIRDNRAEIDQMIKQAYPSLRNRKFSDSDREEWVMNDEGLYRWAESEGVNV